jgi:hypothetical protein
VVSIRPQSEHWDVGATEDSRALHDETLECALRPVWWHVLRQRHYWRVWPHGEGRQYNQLRASYGPFKLQTACFFFQNVASTFQGGYFGASKQYLEQLPIRTIDFDDPVDVERHDKMVSLVQQMLDLHQQRDAARTDQDRKHLQRLIDATDREIDHLVNDLYDLTDEEITIVEGEVG